MDSTKTQPIHTPAPLPVRPPLREAEKPKVESEGEWRTGDAETAEWFNLLLQLVVQTYREELRSNLPGTTGDEAARVKIENWANATLQSDIMDNIVIHSLDLGVSAPRITEARMVPDLNDPNGFVAECNLSYIDTVSVSLSTSVLFNYPVPLFARLPVSLTLSLSLFSANVTIKPPAPTAIAPSVTLTLSPHFHLELRTTSLLGSRAKLADVPKIHQMIEERIKRAIADRATWKFMLPGLAARTAREGLPDILL
ncbi:Maintenance of mitochondrial morphology protein 1 [Ceratobasidium theobromae]|uniref:Maintenance of mitochondrial morphology protein 1 n=1 Tax=Ceratobasidium theobromae TaxID=1582974 RepID=A0A5N5QPC4_9AGAM|nr:Maintenance of mitochondrial morphology protein 1 [Ceratobasidium theobromae]